MQYKAIPNRVARVMARHGVLIRRSPGWIEEAHSGLIIQLERVQSALRIK